MNIENNTDGSQYHRVPVNEVQSEPAPKYGLGVRHLQIFLAFFCLTTLYMSRIQLAVTIVAMTDVPKNNVSVESDVNYNGILYTNISEVVNYENKSVVIEKNQNISFRADVIDYHTGVNINRHLTFWDMNKTYDWSKSKQEMILGSFFLGYFLMMMPMGLLAQKFGGKLPLQIAMLVNGIASIVTPWLAAWGEWRAVCVSRILIGLSQAGMYPSLQVVISKWTTQSERGLLASSVYTGGTAGCVIGSQVAGFLGESSWGWPSTFYAIGVLSLIVFVMISIFMADSPTQHRSISDHEKAYITGSNNDTQLIQSRRTPWRAILRSKAAWTNFASHTGLGTTFAFVSVQVPTYLHHVFNVNIKTSGVLSSLPYIACILTSVGFGLLSDFCINRNLISMKNTRRVYNTVAQIGLSTCLVIMGYTGNLTVAVVCLVLGMASYAGAHLGWMMNHIDLAPNYSAILMATGNTLCNLCVIILPMIVSAVITDMTSQYQWRIIFYIVGGFALVCNGIFVIFLSTDVRHWNNFDQETTGGRNVVVASSEVDYRNTK